MSEHSQVIFVAENQHIPTDLGEELCSVADNTICRNGWTLWEFNPIAWDNEDPLVKAVEDFMQAQDDDSVYHIQILDSTGYLFDSRGDAVYMANCPFAIERVSYLTYTSE